MAYCTEEQVRNQNDKFRDQTEVEPSVIESKIAEAEDVIRTDLSNIISEAELDSIAESSKPINRLAINKATELTLVKIFGASRKVDEVSDIQYFQKEYSKLLKKITGGEINLTANNEDYSPKSYPAGTRKKAKFFPRKGISGFFEDGVTQDIFDDEYK